MKENYIKEKSLDNVGESIPYEVLKVLGQKMEKQICKIECDDGHGTGFFCILRYNWNSYFVLITNNHVLNIKDLKLGNIIKLSLNNDNINYNIKINESRKTYTNKDYDVTIIELKKEDNLDKISFFEIIKHLKINKYIYYIIQKEKEWLFHLE